MSATALLTALTLWGFASPARAEVAANIEQARELFREFEYDRAIELLDEVVEDPSATAAQRVTSLEIAGSIYLLQNQQDRARQAFEQLLELDPGHDMNDPDLPPRVRDAFGSTRDDFVPSLDLDVDLTIPSEPAGQDVTATATVTGTSGAGVDEAVLFVRPSGDDSYESVTMDRGDGAYTAEVELPEAGESLDYYLELRAPSGHVLGGIGSALAPQQVTPSSQEPIPETPTTPRPAIYRQWWFWTVIGVVVVGAGVGLGVGLGARPEEHEDGTLGSVQMPLIQF